MTDKERFLEKFESMNKQLERIADSLQPTKVVPDDETVPAFLEGILQEIREHLMSKIGWGRNELIYMLGNIFSNAEKRWKEE